MIWYFPRMKKEVSNKQDIEMIAENNEAAKSTESVQSDRRYPDRN